jgi:hypothetical protein
LLAEKGRDFSCAVLKVLVGVGQGFSTACRRWARGWDCIGIVLVRVIAGGAPPAVRPSAAAFPLSSASGEIITRHTFLIKPSFCYLKREFLPGQRLGPPFAPVPAPDQHALAVEVLVSTR